MRIELDIDPDRVGDHKMAIDGRKLAVIHPRERESRLVGKTEGGDCLGDLVADFCYLFLEGIAEAAKMARMAGAGTWSPLPPDTREAANDKIWFE